ncbi:PAAR domain-containing protein [Vibrio penaeicida]|uniref:Type VI secretion protein n=1 Tax=Vibrio penaeicida TaxID=104609 RepID=A0AAV5NXJ9_9VIBR|nr:PAAR domain-containing protein [Vibrio penaeicida]RTZ21502.1 hypothetical protein EKN09_19095 [Vibrio penaeicida]GLQ75029.1 hypothetical protein GCM10007932_43910 [Vibrio penaeicida]
MGKPAAHIGSAHTCPAVTGKVPHVGGPVAAGSPNVFVGGMPAARQGDMCVCVGPPDSIAAGSSGVFINGKPAARQGDGTSHGGSVASGNPTVLIGEKASGPMGNGGSSGASKANRSPEDDNRELPSAGEWVSVQTLVELAVADQLTAVFCNRSSGGHCPYCGNGC